MAAAFGFEHCAVGLQRIADAPIGGGVDAELRGAVHFDHVDGALRRAFADGIDRHARPIAGILHQLDRVLFDVVDQDAPGIEGAAEVFEHVENHARALEFVLEVRRVDEDEVMLAHGAGVAAGRCAGGVEGVDGKLHMLLEDFGLVGGVFVEADFADAQDRGAAEESGDFGEDFAGFAEVFGLLGIQADPAVMLDAELCGTLRLGLGKLAVIVDEPGGRVGRSRPRTRARKWRRRRRGPWVS